MAALVLLGLSLSNVLVTAWSILTFGRDTPGTWPSQAWSIGKPVASVAFSPDGRMLALGLRDGSIQLKQTSDGNLIRTLAGHADEVRTVTFSPNGRMLASAGKDNGVGVWQVSDGTLMQAWTNGRGGVEAIAFSPDNQMLASNGVEGAINLWNVNDGQPIYTFPGTPRSFRSGMAFVKRIHFSADGLILTAGTDEDSVQQWRLPEGRLVNSQEGFRRHSTGNTARSVCFSPDGSAVAIAYDGIPDALVWRVSDGKAIYTLDGHQTDIWSLAFSPDGRMLATGGGRSNVSPGDDFIDTSIRIWAMADGRQQAKLTGHKDSVRSLAWSPDSTLLASGSDDGTVRLWNVK